MLHSEITFDPFQFWWQSIFHDLIVAGRDRYTHKNFRYVSVKD